MCSIKRKCPPLQGSICLTLCIQGAFFGTILRTPFSGYMIFVETQIKNYFIFFVKLFSHGSNCNAINLHETWKTTQKLQRMYLLIWHFWSARHIIIQKDQCISFDLALFWSWRNIASACSLQLLPMVSKEDFLLLLLPTCLCTHTIKETQIRTQAQTQMQVHPLPFLERNLPTTADCCTLMGSQFLLWHCMALVRA